MNIRNINIEDNTIIGGKRKTTCDLQAQDIVILGGKDASGGDDSFFWEELLADDDKDWSKEFLGIEVKDNAKS